MTQLKAWTPVVKQSTPPENPLFCLTRKDKGGAIRVASPPA